MLDDNQIVGTNGKESKTFVVSIAVDETTGQVFCGFSNNYYNPMRNNTLVANKMFQRLNIVKTWIETKNIMPKKRRNYNEKTIIDKLNNCGEYLKVESNMFHYVAELKIFHSLNLLIKVYQLPIIHLCDKPFHIRINIPYVFTLIL